MTNIKFEDAIKKLENIVEELEAGELSLDESLSKYEEGIKLASICQKKLEAAKKRIEMLVKSKDGNVRLEPFEYEDEDKAKKKKKDE